MTPTPGDELGTPLSAMKWIWGGVLSIVLVFGFGVTEREVITRLIESQGTVDQEGALFLAFAFGYTLPLTAGIAISTLLYLQGTFAKMEFPLGGLVIVAGILFVSGLLAARLGLGLLPSYESKLVSGPIYVSIPLWVFQGYFNTYGWPLMICAAAMGIAGALHYDAWKREHSPD